VRRKHRVDKGPATGQPEPPSPARASGAAAPSLPATRPSRARAPSAKLIESVAAASTPRVRAEVVAQRGGMEARAAEAAALGATAAAQPVAQEEGGGDGVTDLSQLHGAVEALTERHLTPVPAPPDEPAEPEATKLSLEPPEQPTKMVALLAQCSAIEAESVKVGEETAACLKMCADKEGALYAHTDKLKAMVVQAEEEQQNLEVGNQSLQQAGLDTNEVRAKLNDTNSSVDQLRRKLVACGQALADVQSLPEELQQQVPPPTPYPLYPRPTPHPTPRPTPRPRHRHHPYPHLTVSTQPTGRRRTRARCAAREWQICPRSCRAARRRFPTS
jgi:hypothetical protein